MLEGIMNKLRYVSFFKKISNYIINFTIFFPKFLKNLINNNGRIKKIITGIS